MLSHYKETLGIDDTRVTFFTKIKHKPIVAPMAAKTDRFNQRYRLPMRDGR